MAKPVHHPRAEHVDLSSVLDAFADRVRREIVARLEQRGEANCSTFLSITSKTNLSYHLARLREAGVTRTRIEGTQRFISLRRQELDARFPGLFDAIMQNAATRPTRAARSKTPRSSNARRGKAKTARNR